MGRKRCFGASGLAIMYSMSTVQSANTTYPIPLSLDATALALEAPAPQYDGFTLFISYALASTAGPHFTRLVEGIFRVGWGGSLRGPICTDCGKARTLTVTLPSKYKAISLNQSQPLEKIFYSHRLNTSRNNLNNASMPSLARWSGCPPCTGRLLQQPLR